MDCLNGGDALQVGMPPAYDLILKTSGGLITRTIHVPDAAEAWRLARGALSREHSGGGLSGHSCS